MKVCPRCGTPNENIARYCKRCGTYIYKVCPNCGYSNQNDAMFCVRCGTPLGNLCPKCGYVNLYEALYCAKCGTPLNQSTRLIAPRSEIRTIQNIPYTRNINPYNQPTRRVEQVNETIRVTPPNQITRKKEKKRLLIISSVAVVIVALIITSLFVFGINVHDAVGGVRPLNSAELDSILGGNWNNLTPTFTSNLTTLERYLHTNNLEGAVNAYYQFFGSSNYTLFVTYINFSSSSYANQFYQRYAGGIKTTINTYPASILIENNAEAGVAQFGNYVIFIEIYGDLNNENVNFSPNQIESLISYMEITS